MKAQKYRRFAVTLKNGEVIETKAPAGALTLKFAKLYAPHWAKVNETDIADVTPIK